MTKRILLALALAASLGGAVLACNSPSGTAGTRTSPAASIDAGGGAGSSDAGGGAGASDMVSPAAS